MASLDRGKVGCLTRWRVKATRAAKGEVAALAGVRVGVGDGGGVERRPEAGAAVHAGMEEAGASREAGHYPMLDPDTSREVRRDRGLAQDSVHALAVSLRIG